MIDTTHRKHKDCTYDKDDQTESIEERASKAYAKPHSEEKRNASCQEMSPTAHRICKAQKRIAEVIDWLHAVLSADTAVDCFHQLLSLESASYKPLCYDINYFHLMKISKIDLMLRKKE